jgi:hypothetical protein
MTGHCAGLFFSRRGCKLVGQEIQRIGNQRRILRVQSLSESFEDLACGQHGGGLGWSR